MDGWMDGWILKMSQRFARTHLSMNAFNIESDLTTLPVDIANSLYKSRRLIGVATVKTEQGQVVKR